jgi:divalent metal cation (Fe/Co/Zn/Cd) transporter
MATPGDEVAGQGRHDHHDHDHHHEHGGLRHFVSGLFAPHSHDAKDSLDQALESSRDGIRAVALSLVILLLAAAVQALVTIASGSVALLGDTLHNAADGLTALPLWLAFRLGRRPPTSRFTYGYGKAEDLAGIAVIGLIAASAALAGYEAIDRLVHPHTVTHLGFVMAAAAVGAVAVALGVRWADAVVGLLITAAIVVVGYGAVRSVGQRLLDAVDPTVVDTITSTVTGIDGVVAVTEVRARWSGHRLLAQVRLSVDGHLSVASAHAVAETAHHALLHRLPNLSDAIIHVDPVGLGPDPHTATAHHHAGET